MTPERYRKLKATLDRRQPDLTLLTEQIHKPRNVAALIRTCDAVGIHQLHSVWHPDSRPFSGTTMGSDRWVEKITHPSIEDGIAVLQAAGMKVYAAHLSDSAKPYREIDYTESCAILLGNEQRGVSEVAAQLVDGHIVIPMVGMVESYNVSVAAAIILAEAQHQRQIAGFYDQVRLDPSTWQRTFFTWAYPELAQYCEKRGLDYPAIDPEDGTLVDPSTWYARVRTQA